jgi:hypothetical protein
MVGMIVDGELGAGTGMRTSVVFDYCIIMTAADRGSLGKIGNVALLCRNVVRPWAPAQS